MKSPILIALSATALGLLVAVLLVLWEFGHPRGAAGNGARARGAPWQVELPAPGRSEVLGLRLPGSTLGQARQRWGTDLKLALMAGQDGNLALEGSLESFEAGGVTGRLLLAFDARPDLMSRWRDALPGTPIASGGRQHTLNEAATAELAAAALVGISFIPVAQLDAGMLSARFGHPAERIATGGRLEHWLYPAFGLAVVLDAEGREVLQYVAPGEFERRLAAPVRTIPPKP